MTRRADPMTLVGSAPHGIRYYDILWHSMAQKLQERLPAGHIASICGTAIAGDLSVLRTPATS